MSNVAEGSGVKLSIRYMGIILLFVLILPFTSTLLACSGTAAIGTELPAIRSHSIAHYYPVIVEPKQESTSKPDLIIESITWSPENPSKGDTVTLTVTVKNQGSGIAISSQVNFYVNGSFKSSQYVQSLEAGDLVTKDFTWTAEQGSHLIKMIIDEENWFSESDETNNEKSVTISILTPDLIIQTIAWSPSDPSVGDNVTFTVTVKNQGESKAVNPLVVFHVDGNRLAAKSIGTIGPGSAYSTTFSWLAQADSHIIELIIDPNNSILESDESNNEKIADFPTLSPDLIVQGITWLPTELSVGETVTFSVTFKNQGRAVAASFRFSFYVGGKSSGSQNVPRIAVGGSVVETFTWVAEAGSNTVRVVVDSDNKVTESDESNNEMAFTFSGTKIPDLVVESITWSPANPSIGEELTFSVIIKNKGNGRADSSQVACYVDDTRLASARINSIEAGGTQNTTFTWTVQEGHHNIKIFADSNGIIFENDKDNNEKTVIYPVPADLLIKEISLSPSHPVEGDNVTFTVTIENQGDSRADDFNIGYYIDDVYLGYASANAINPETTGNSVFLWTAAIGPHSVKATADIHDRILEKNENNNEIVKSFSVIEQSVSTTAPDSSVEINPETKNTEESQPTTEIPVGTGVEESQPATEIPVGTGVEESKNSFPLYYLLVGLVVFILISTIAFYYWRRRDYVPHKEVRPGVSTTNAEHDDGEKKA